MSTPDSSNAASARVRHTLGAGISEYLVDRSGGSKITLQIQHIDSRIVHALRLVN